MVMVTLSNKLMNICNIGSLQRVGLLMLNLVKRAYSFVTEISTISDVRWCCFYGMEIDSSWFSSPDVNMVSN